VGGVGVEVGVGGAGDGYYGSEEDFGGDAGSDGVGGEDWVVVFLFCDEGTSHRGPGLWVRSLQLLR
jgi:hypothetical protein